MLGLPEWVLGVGAILVFLAALQVVYVRLMPPEDRRHGRKGGASQTPDDIHARLAELEDVKQRLGELEERVDFAERLLTRQRESDRLGQS